jgi:hypothetical protein
VYCDVVCFHTGIVLTNPLLLLLLLLVTTILQVVSGDATSGPERRATLPLYNNEAAGAGTITWGDASTASAARGREATIGTLMLVCNSIQSHYILYLHFC